jgi:hypothetical protein
MIPQTFIAEFDAFMASRRASFEAVIVGSTALALLGVFTRHTKDCDVLEPVIPEGIQLLARQFAEEQRQKGSPISDDWLNNGPASLVRDLPEGWRKRLQLVFTGKALKLHTLGRIDLLRSKLFALCDRGVDLGDCVALSPTPEEIEEIRPWIEHLDGNPDWPDHVRRTLEDLKGRLSHGI